MTTVPPDVELIVAVRARAVALAAADRAFRDAVAAAVADGHSLRAVADASGISHTKVLRIVNQEGVTIRDA